MLQRVRQGDEAALIRLLEKNAPFLQRAAQHLLGNLLQPHLDSEDIIQSVCRSLLIGFRGKQFTFATSDQLLALATTMLRRKIAHQWRHLKHVPGVGADTVHDDQLSEIPAKPSSEPTLDLDDELHHLLRHMDAVDRQLVELRFKGYSTADAARELGMDPHILRVHLGRIRKRLRDSGGLPDWM